MVSPLSRFEWSHLRRWEAIAIVVSKEEHAFAEPLSALRGLNPLASSSTCPYGLNKAPGTTFNIGTIVTT